jgi:hypothetical protein
MKTRDLKIDWLIPFVGIAVVAGTVVAATSYLDCERKADAAEAFAVTLDRLFHDQQLSMVLEQIHRGEVIAAARRLDLLLCGDILRADSELTSADALTRAAVEDVFRRIALIRPSASAGGNTGSAQEPSDDQVEAQRILTLALGAATHAAQAK